MKTVRTLVLVLHTQPKENIINSIFHSQFKLISAFANFFDACLVTFAQILSMSPVCFLRHFQEGL